MHAKFVNTKNARNFVKAIGALQQRGASEACLMVVDGNPGLSKTTVTRWYATQTGSLFLRAKKEWTPAWFLRELLSELRITPENSFEKMFKQAIQALADRAAEAERQRKTFAMIVDEVDYISRSPRLLETIRDLADMLEIPVILVGMGKVRHNLTRFPQVASRVGQYVEFKAADLDDVKAMVTSLCEVEVKEDLVDFLHRTTGGFLREVKEAIAAIERFGKRNQGQAIGLNEMAGEVLFNSRRTGEAVEVAA